MAPSTSSRKANFEIPRPYKCPICEKAFYRLEHQTRHIRTHTGEKPHVCTYPGCVKKFSRSDELTRHLRIHSNPPMRRDQRKAQAQAADSMVSISKGSVSSAGAAPAQQKSVKNQQKRPTPPFEPSDQSKAEDMHLDSGASPQTLTTSSASSSYFDIHALAIAATQELERERERLAQSSSLNRAAAANMLAAGFSPSASVTPGGGTPTLGTPNLGQSVAFSRQVSAPALTSYFSAHHRPNHNHCSSVLDRHAASPSGGMALRMNGREPLEQLSKKSRANSPSSSIPVSPSTSRPESPSAVDFTPLVTPAHSPRLLARDASEVHLPAIRTLPASRFSNATTPSSGPGTPSQPIPPLQPLQPIEPVPVAFSSLRRSHEGLPSYMSGVKSHPQARLHLDVENMTSLPMGQVLPASTRPSSGSAMGKVALADIMNP